MIKWESSSSNPNVFKPATVDSTPGPADYRIAPAVESCLRLDTFNVTLPGKTLCAPLALRRS
ncbi:hypothetical protein AHF37_08498 [Paragonimus kellicotti]|nr:hypothetical protein AHF37_08498 [Paragonimus kellicotti]